jgi:archaellum component FlaC
MKQGGVQPVKNEHNSTGNDVPKVEIAAHLIEKQTATIKELSDGLKKNKLAIDLIGDQQRLIERYQHILDEQGAVLEDLYDKMGALSDVVEEQKKIIAEHEQRLNELSTSN